MYNSIYYTMAHTVGPKVVISRPIFANDPEERNKSLLFFSFEYITGLIIE